MIDFENKKFFKLSEIKRSEGEKVLSELLVEGEKVIVAFSSLRDKLIFTNKRIVAVNVQGLTGTKTSYSSIPLSKIQAFSIETAGVLDLDAEIDIVISSLGTIRFELSTSSDIKNVCREISQTILK